MHRPLSAIAALAVVAAVALPVPSIGASAEPDKGWHADLRYFRRHRSDHYVEKGRDLHVHAVATADRVRSIRGCDLEIRS